MNALLRRVIREDAEASYRLDHDPVVGTRTVDPHNPVEVIAAALGMDPPEDWRARQRGLDSNNGIGLIVD